MSVEEPLPTCFIAMPVTTLPADAQKFDDPDHWAHVMQAVFVPSIREAGFEPLLPIAQGSVLIHEGIIRHLENADLVLCDLSSHNPNVFFELGVRTALNKPVALVKDQFTALPFDASGINTFSYDSALKGWNLESERAALTAHLHAAWESCGGLNPLWRKFGLTMRATESSTPESPTEAKLDLLLSRIPAPKQDMSGTVYQLFYESETGLKTRPPERQNTLQLIWDHPTAKAFREAVVVEISPDVIDGISIDEVGVLEVRLAPTSAPKSKAIQASIEELANRYEIPVNVIQHSVKDQLTYRNATMHNLKY